MRKFFTLIPTSLLAIFSLKNLWWHALMIALTGLLVAMGFDWQYFAKVSDTPFSHVFRFAGILGFVGPFLIFIGLWILGAMRDSKRLNIASWAVLQAAFLGWLVSSMYKVFTGRAHPPHQITDLLMQISREFHFGVWEGGIFWGWPSSHTTVSFAIAFVLIVFFRGNKWVTVPALGYAVYIAIGASASFHWFSDVVAGLILGIIVGIAVGKAFLQLDN